MKVHPDTLESQKDPYIGLTIDQKEELKKIYTDKIHFVLNDLCDLRC